MEESKNIGEITLGYGSDSARKVVITDMVRCEFADHRLVTVAHTDEDAYLLSVENPQSTGRASQTNMYLTEEAQLLFFILTSYIWNITE